jgi:hypothetical protein
MSIEYAQYMHMETENKDIQVTVGLPARLYSRLALLAHRHDQTLGEAIRAGLQVYVDAWLAEGEERPGYVERTITREGSTESG